jgi:cytochrome P450
VQDKCFKEICDVIGAQRQPSLSDRPKMVYLEATIMEVLRKADITPVGVPHATACDVTFQGHFIPKGTLVMLNHTSVLLDPAIWGDPENFRPERFIGPDGKLTKTEEFMPFGLGRRVCLGESLARMELFLYLCCMVQRFHFLPEDPDHLPSLEGVVSNLHFPVPFKIRSVLRK